MRDWSMLSRPAICWSRSGTAGLRTNRPMIRSYRILRNTPVPVSRANEQSCGCATKPLRACSENQRIKRLEALSTSLFSGVAEDAAENRIDLRQVIIEVEFLAELFFAQVFAYVLVGFKKGEEVAFAFPHFHRIALDQPIGVFA